MSVGSTMRSPASSRSSAQLSMRPASSNDAPTWWPWAARNVKAMPPPTTSESTRSSRARSTPSFSPTLAPPTTATKGRSGATSSPPRVPTSRASRRPAADGRRVGGPTIEAWARCEAPKASFT